MKFKRIKDLREDHDYKQEEIAKYLKASAINGATTRTLSKRSSTPP